MKKTYKTPLLCLLLIFLSTIGKAQHYFIIDNQIKNSPINYSHVTSEYLGEKFEMLNVFYKCDTSSLSFNAKHYGYGYQIQGGILVVGILPKVKNIPLIWQNIDLDTIKDKLIGIDSIFHQFYANEDKMNPKYASLLDVIRLQKINLIPVLVKNGKYFTPKQALILTEFFNVIPDYQKSGEEKQYLSIFKQSLNQFYVLDMNASQQSISDFENIYHKNTGDFSSNFAGHRIFSSYFRIRATDSLWNNDVVKRFWLFGDWVSDSPNDFRGIDRLSFHSKYGVIAGAYSAFFKYRNFSGKSNRISIEESRSLNSILQHDYLHNIQSTPLRIELNGKVVYENYNHKN